VDQEASRSHPSIHHTLKLYVVAFFLPETHPQNHPQPSPAHFWGVLFSIVHGPDDDSSFRFKHPMPPLFFSTDVFPGNNKKNKQSYLPFSFLFFLSVHHSLFKTNP
jgi:hypothetical protein